MQDGKSAVEYRTETFQIGNCTVTVRRPVLSDRERAKAERNVISALERYGKYI